MLSAILLGALAASVTTGLILIVRGATPTVVPEKVEATSAARVLARRYSPKALGISTRYLLIGLGVGLLGAVVTRMVVLIIMTPLAAVLLPALIGSPQSDRIARLQALESWTRAMSGVLVAGSGVEEAIRSSLHSVPEVLRPSVSRLTARIRAGQSLELALRSWADEVDDQNADMIAAALIQGAQRQGGLSRSLAELADVVSDRVRVAQDIESDRATPRTTVRYVTLISLAILVGLVFVSPSFSTAYASPLGQVVFTALLTAYLASLWWIRSITYRTSTTRFLGSEGKTA